jgi:hypothetical protein
VPSARLLTALSGATDGGHVSNNRKIYIMSVACSGKTTFASRTPHFAGCRVVDSEEFMPQVSGIARWVLYFARLVPVLGRLVRNDKAVAARRDEYYSRVFQFLREQDEPIVVMGRPGPPDLTPYDDIAFGAVLIPWEDHKERCMKRRRELRNPFPFLHHSSTKLDRIAELRDYLQNYATSRRIPIFSSFAEAITELAERGDRRVEADAKLNIR